MTLAVGTALQNGTYVVDAWVSEDAVGPVYLAMHVPKGQWIQLRVLGSRQPEALPPATERQAFYHYLKQVNDLKHGTFPTPLGGFEEEGICYQTLANPPGLPLDRLSPLAQPRPARLSLGIVKQILDSLEALRPLGWAGLRLTPDQVWFAPETQTITLTGFDLPLIPAAEAEADRDRTPAVEANLVRELSHLLYFLLTGQRAEHTNAPLAVDLRRRRPELPTNIDQALELGSPRRPGASADTEPQSALTLADWGRLLPAIADLPADLPQPSPTVRPAPPLAPSAGPKTLVASPKPDRAVATPASRSRSLPVLALAFTGL
ncbi:MAG TPA: hypothetical protein VLS96_19495, partial [Nodosilinea sp.]|nr:hypothetical protein [Nodosilinea sp.]